MRIDVLTIFPDIVEQPIQASLLGKAQREGVLSVRAHNIRAYTSDKHASVDDAPFGGGPGMVMGCEPIVEAVDALRCVNSCNRIVLLSPRGDRLDQARVRNLVEEPDLVLICGRYEGVDERVCEVLGAEEISIGDYVLSGGEFAALVVIDAVARMLPGVVGDYGSVETDSFYDGILGPPQYTRPAEFRGAKVPEVLLSGHHEAIRQYRRKEALRITRARRPELLAGLNPEDQHLLEEIEREERG